MAVTLTRQISDDEKKRVLEIHGRKCYATGHNIPENETVFFDHIKAFDDTGESEIDNIAPMCKHHNEQKGRLPLEDFRVKLKIDDFFKLGNTLTLKDELEYLKKNKEITSFGNIVSIVNQENDNITLEVENSKISFKLYACPTTSWKYFYATLPINVINSDDDEEHEIGLQPRFLIKDKVFNLYRHFQKHPVLQPSIGRLYKDRILIFDGQHKIAAMLWGGRKEFELKVYINPEPQLLNKTNISAHDKYAQTRFFSSIMVSKLGSQFGKQFEDYKNLEDGSKKSEAGFVKYLKEKEQLSNSEINKRFTSYLYDSVLEKDKNKIVRLISTGNRGSSECPLTMDMLNKSLLANFLYREPVEDDMTSPYYQRETEIDNLIRLFNIIDQEALCNWDGTRPETDTNQNKLNRMFRSKSIMAWSELLFDAICAKLEIEDRDEKAIIFYRELTDEQFDKIQSVVRRLVSWKLWSSPVNSEIDRVLADNKSEVKKYFREKGLTTGFLMGAPE